jgi:4-diphosphocytidyl-2-C-methyl-D-erythritol kinase
LFDELIVERTAGSSRLSVPEHPELEGPDNLVWKAANWMLTQAGIREGVAMTLRKRIPLAAGLGGGSSDAAGCLLGLQTLFGIDPAAVNLFKGASLLGADVPFFLKGATAVGEGRGERLTQIVLKIDYNLLLVNPGFPVSTAELFRLYDANLTSVPRPAKLWAILAKRPEVTELLHNDLQPTAVLMRPEIAEATHALRTMGLTHVLMTGSGPTVFSLIPRESGAPATERCPSRWTFFFAAPWFAGPIVD